LLGVFFPEDMIGFAVGKNGTILKTINGGESWTGLPSGTVNYLSKTYFIDADTGYIVGTNGTILKTTNGGSNWIHLTSGTTNTLYTVFFPSAYAGYAVGANGTILNTINRGTDWTTQSSGTTESLITVFFPDEDTGYIVGTHGTILKTMNGGFPPVGINEKKQPGNLKISPNPASEKINIELPEPGTLENWTIFVCRTDGREIISKNGNGSRSELNISSLPKGLYFIRITNSEKSFVGKFIKE
jgi:photosystem II stability/assembly factor-like uncharacterized protein